MRILSSRRSLRRSTASLLAGTALAGITSLLAPDRAWAQYMFSTFTVGSNGTFLSGINDNAEVTGGYGFKAGTSQAFVTVNGVVTPLVAPGFFVNDALGINDIGKVAGSFLANSPGNIAWQGFVYSNGSFTPVNVSGADATQVLGINNHQQLVGYSTNNSTNISSGFIYTNGSFAPVTVPGAASVNPLAINDRNQIVGLYQAVPLGPGLGFFLDSNGAFTPIAVLGATTTVPLRINDRGQIVGYYLDALSNPHGFIYFNGTYTSFDVPLPGGSGFTQGWAINNYGQIVGGYGSESGFIATPVGPATLYLDLGGLATSVGTLFGTGIVTNSGSSAATLTIGFDNASNTFSGVIQDGAGVTALTKAGTGTQTLSGINTYTGATTIASGTLALTGAGSIASSSGVLAIGAFDISGVSGAGTSIKSLSGSGSVALGAKTLTLTNASGNFAGVIGGTGGFALAAGKEILSGINTYTGATTITSGILALTGAGSIASSSGVLANGGFDISGVSGAGTSIKDLSGAGSVALGAKTLTLTNASGNFAGVIGGAGGFTLAAGKQILSGVNTYTGATSVNGRTLEVSGSIASSMLTTVNAGGTLTGTGIVGSTTVAGGGTFIPGNGTPGSSMTVAGNLAFQSGALYLVQVSPSTASFANVSGTEN